jgi:hypothetical protein
VHGIKLDFKIEPRKFMNLKKCARIESKGLKIEKKLSSNSHLRELPNKFFTMSNPRLDIKEKLQNT